MGSQWSGSSETMTMCGRQTTGGAGTPTWVRTPLGPWPGRIHVATERRGETAMRSWQTLVVAPMLRQRLETQQRQAPVRHGQLHQWTACHRSQTSRSIMRSVLCALLHPPALLCLRHATCLVSVLAEKPVHSRLSVWCASSRSHQLSAAKLLSSPTPSPSYIVHVHCRCNACMYAFAKASKPFDALACSPFGSKAGTLMAC